MTDYEPTRAYIRETIDTSVRSGSGDQEDLAWQMEDQVRDEFREEDEATLEAEVAAFRVFLEECLEKQRQAETTWNELTTNDRIERAFLQLQSEGIVALHDAGYTITDAWELVDDAAQSVNGAWGGAFYHRQDVERGVEGAGLMIAFGAFTNGDDHESESLRLAHRVCAVLMENGVATEWDGSIASRIAIPGFEWRRRRFTSPPR